MNAPNVMSKIILTIERKKGWPVEELARTFEVRTVLHPKSHQAADFASFILRNNNLSTNV